MGVVASGETVPAGVAGVTTLAKQRAKPGAAPPQASRTVARVERAPPSGCAPTGPARANRTSSAVERRSKDRRPALCTRTPSQMGLLVEGTINRLRAGDQGVSDVQISPPRGQYPS